MNWDGTCDVAAVPRHDVVALFARRPARWFHTFLVLAAHQAAPTGAGRARGGRTERHWYRLSVPDECEVVRFVWHPVPHPGLFSGFSGHIHVESTPEGSRIVLKGETADGDDEVTEAALGGLLHLLSSAFDGIATDA